MFQFKLTYLLLFIVLSICISFADQKYEKSFINLSGDWKFRIDPQDNGISEKWYSANLNDTDWDSMTVPGFWESRESYRNYDGAAWYRNWIEIPRDFNIENVFLGLGGMDDEFDLWINGKHLGHFGNQTTGDTYYMHRSVHDVSEWLFPGRHLFVFRLIDWQGGGGIHRGPVALASDTTYFYTRVERVKRLAKMYPQALMPFWVEGNGRSWTVIGLEEAVSEALVSRDGSLGSKDFPFSLSIWLNIGKGRIYAPELLQPSQLKWSLIGGFLPMPSLEFGDETIKITQIYYAVDSSNLSGGRARIHYKILSHSEIPIEADLYLAVRPYQVQGRVSELQKVIWNDGSKIIEIDDKFTVLTDLPEPDAIIRQPVSLLDFSRSPGDVSLYSVLSDNSELFPDVMDTVFKMNAAAFRWCIDINPGKNSFRFEIPLGKNKNLSRFQSLPDIQDSIIVANQWKSSLKKVLLSIPDWEITNAYYASLAYILINADQNMPHPGPWAYDFFWYRDTAYILAALLRNGFFDFSRRAVKHLTKAQKDNGEFPPIFDLNYKQVGHREWDSQGEGLFAIAEYVRFSSDTSIIQEHWHSIQNAVSFLDSLLGESEQNILPPSWSAEDLGSGNWHHFWDDFWAVRGMQDAAWMANLIGRQQEAFIWNKKAETLRENVLLSIRKMMLESDIEWIPNGPEDLYGSSMARGTTPGLFPGGALNPHDPLVINSFNYYYEKWVQPYQGAYLHQGTFWPYAFELASCYVLLNQPKRAHMILNWHLMNQTFPGVYAWGEQLDTANVRFAAGDIPHAWVAADYINLIRTMLVYEKEDTLTLGAGIPFKWLQSGTEVGIRHAPTYFGNLDYTLQLDSMKQNIQWKLNISKSASCKLKLYVPKEIRIDNVRVEGEKPSVFGSHHIILNSPVHKVLAQITLCL